MVDAFLDKLNRITPEKWRWVLEHEGFRKYFKNTGWMFLGQMGSLLAAFFIGAWLARYFGPTKYGAFNYGVAFAGLFGFIASLGVDGILSRDLVDKKDEAHKLIGTAFVLQFVGGFTAFALSTFSAIWLFNQADLVKIVMIYSLIFFAGPLNLINIFFQAQVQAKTVSIIKLAALVISSFFKILLIFNGGGIIALAFVVAGEYFLISLFALMVYRLRGYHFSKWSFDRQLAKRILAGSLFLMLAAGANYIFMRADQVMIGWMLSDYSVGLYAAAIRFVEVWYFVPVILCASLFPAIVRARQSDSELYRNRLRLFFKLLFFIGLLVSIAVSLAAIWFTEPLFGAAYRQSIFLTIIYAWSSVGLFVGWGIYHYLLSDNRTRSIFYFYAISMLLNIILNYFFIRAFGLSGAAWSTLLSYTIGPIIVLLRWRLAKKL